MDRVRIKIGIIGYLPFEFNLKKIKHWRSGVFKITGVDEYDIKTSRADTSDWGYSDDLLNKELPERSGEDIFIGVTYVPIENNFYARRLENNRVIVSFCGIYQDIIENNIPVENLLLRVIYASSIIYKIEREIRPVAKYRYILLHDDTRGCIFDMTGNDKRDVIYSLDRPQLCDACKSNLRANNIPNNTIKIINTELLRIKKGRFYHISQFIKKRPFFSMLITIVTGIIVSLIANAIYDLL